MSFGINLIGEHGNSVEVDKHVEGGTFVLGGTTRASLNVTYNYSRFYSETIDRDEGIRWLYGKKASECIPRLKEAIDALGAEQDEDYWAATAGNAGHALSILLKWAEQHPDAVFKGD